jgi:hypothetical protein
VLPATAQSYGDARDIVNGAGQIRSDATCSSRCGNSSWMRSMLAKHSEGVCRELDLTFKGALIRSTECADSGAWRYRAAHLLGTEDFQVRPNRLRITPAACQLSFEYFQRRQAGGGRMPRQ